jgi:S1-C subfamily serine protease
LRTRKNAMRKTPLYSRSRPASQDARAAAQAAPAPPAIPWRIRLGQRIAAARMPLALFACALLAIAVALYAAWRPLPRPLTQKDIDAAVLHTLDSTPLPSMAAKAYAAVRPSVVHVRGLRHVKTDDAPADKSLKGRARRPQPAKPGERARTAKPAGQPPSAKPGEHPRAEADSPDELYRIGVGTGVVIVASGLILTNLHVIDGAEAIVVTFADGTESPADVVNTQPENDLAVLKARIVPDDLPAATLRSTADLNVGDQVVAIGYPFGIGPSASAGVVSGLKREYHSPEGNKTLTNLIQFDAAANPGNSGGPLVTADGEVVGIVTGIFNPTDQRVFIGIGFAVPIENAAAAVGLSPF